MRKKPVGISQFLDSGEQKLAVLFDRLLICSCVSIISPVNSQYSTYVHKVKSVLPGLRFRAFVQLL